MPLCYHDLRDKQVLAFDKGEIQEIRLIKGGQSLVCARSEISATAVQEPTPTNSPPVEEVIWQSAEGENCDEKKLNRLLTTLSNLRYKRYIDDKKKEAFADPVYRIELKGVPDYYLSIFAKGEEDEKGCPPLPLRTTTLSCCPRAGQSPS
jgi:hypothetical protein